MKKIILFIGIFIAGTLSATIWKVTKTCGKTASLETQSGVTDSELKSIVAAINYDLCSTLPQHITIVY